MKLKFLYWLSEGLLNFSVWRDSHTNLWYLYPIMYLTINIHYWRDRLAFKIIEESMLHGLLKMSTIENLSNNKVVLFEVPNKVTENYITIGYDENSK